jgi:hypothetical protein
VTFSNISLATAFHDCLAAYAQRIGIRFDDSNGLTTICVSTRFNKTSKSIAALDKEYGVRLVDGGLCRIKLGERSNDFIVVGQILFASLGPGDVRQPKTVACTKHN